MCIRFFAVLPVSASPSTSFDLSLIENVSCYKLLGVHLPGNLTWNEHVTHIVKKGSKRLYVIRALRKCGSTDRQLILVYCSIITSLLEYASPAWAGLTQYLSYHIESIQKRALRITFPSLSYEDALKRSGLIFAAPEERGCVHKISQAKVLFFRPATKVSAACCIHREDRMPLTGTGETVSVPAFPRSNIDLEILAPSNTRIAFKIPNYDLS